MIEYIKYTVDGQTYELIYNGDGTWSKDLNAPNVSGLYDLTIEIKQNGFVTIIDSSDPRYNIYLEVINEIQSKVHLIEYAPPIIQEILDYQVIYKAEDVELDAIYYQMDKILDDTFIMTASNEMITRIENFFGIVGQGSLMQRKLYLLALFRKGNKLNEQSIKEITNSITGSDCIVKFFGADDPTNPHQGYGFLRIQVLSPSNDIPYRYSDIERALKPLIPAHIKLSVIRYFATWGDIRDNFLDWNAVASMNDWQEVKNYLPPL